MVHKLVLLICFFSWLWLLAYVRITIIFFAHKQQIVRLPDQRLKSPSESQLLFPDLQVPLYSGVNGLFKYDSSSSTHYCFIPRPPGQHILFEQQLMDFRKHYPGGISILVVIPVSNSAKFLADMINQLLHFTEMIGHVRILFSFGIRQSLDDTYYEIYQITDALHLVKIVNRVQFPDDLDDWTRRTLVEYMNDFKIAVILRGVICATDLVHLVIQAVENNADLTCSLDIKFDSGHRISTTSSALDFASRTPLSTEDLLHASTLIQSRSCESSVQVLSFSSLLSGNACILQNILSNYTSRWLRSKDIWNIARTWWLGQNSTGPRCLSRRTSMVVWLCLWVQTI